MLYEIINPSDPYTLESDAREAACLACLLLGRGHFGLRSIEDNDKSGMPIFLFGGVEEWWSGQFGYPFGEATERVGRARLADALDSVLIGSAADRATVADALAAIDDPVKRASFRDKYHDRARTSMSNIGGAAYHYAAKLRERAAG